MFNALIARLKGSPKERPLPELDLRLAMAALLVRIAKADGHYAVEEIARIDKVLARTHGLGPIEAAKLRAEAERIEAAAPAETGAFVAEIRAHIPHEARATLHAAMWEVGLVERSLDPQEETLLNEMSAALGITPDGGEPA